MKAEEKSRELVQKITDTIFESGNTVSKPMVKEVAVICVEEIISVLNNSNEERELRKTKWQYWQSVKQHLQNL